MLTAPPPEMNDRSVLFKHFERSFDFSSSALLQKALSSVVFVVSRTLKPLCESGFICKVIKTYRRSVEIAFVAASTAALCFNLTAGTTQLHSPSITSIKPKIVLATESVAGSLAKASHLAVARYIAKRFHVGLQTAKEITLQAYRAAKENGIKPALILAVAAVESGYKPTAINLKSGARGLMQILPYWHRQAVRSVGGPDALLKIRPNIKVGAEILATYLQRSHGRLTGALYIYCGHVGYLRYLKQVRAQLNSISYIISNAKASLRFTAIKTMNRLAVHDPMFFVNAKS